MDREVAEKVKRIVIATLEEMKKNGAFSRQRAVKIWPHQTPLPDPVVMKYAELKEPENKDSIVTISPYM